MLKWPFYCIFLLLVFSYYPIYQEEIPKSVKIPPKRADFKQVLAYILKREGNYCFIPEDFGQETYAGITRRYSPNSPIWRVIDEYKKHHIIKWNDTIPGTKWYVNMHYVDLFVDNGFFDIEDQDICNQTFDCFVNSNYKGFIIINKTLSEMGYNIPIIGEMTPNTVKYLNKVDKWKFLAIFTSNRAQFYSELVIKRPNQLIFLGNWMSRIKVQPK